MDKKIIVITGCLASGKSTFALGLARQVNVPYLIKDTFKSAICRSIKIPGRSVSSQLSAAAFDGMLYVTERVMETGGPIIIEGNFMPPGVKPVDEAGAIRELAGRYGYSKLTFRFTGDPAVLHRRFTEREQSPERGDANRIGSPVSLETFRQWCRSLDGFDIGGQLVEVDTTDFAAAGLDRCIERAVEFLG